jgi:hypothetical protein
METQRKEVETEVDRGLTSFLATITAIFLAFIIVFNIVIFISEI